MHSQDEVFTLDLVLGYLLVGVQHLYGTEFQIPNKILEKHRSILKLSFTI